MPWRHPEYGYIEFYPDRVRMPDGSTRTGEAVDAEAIAAAGWVWEDFPLYRTDPEPFDENGMPRY